MLGAERPFPEVWVVSGDDGVDLASPLEYMAQEHANIMAEQFPEQGPWRVHRYVLAAPIAPERDRNQAGASSSGDGFKAPRQGEFAEYPAIAPEPQTMRRPDPQPAKVQRMVCPNCKASYIVEEWHG